MSSVSQAANNKATVPSPRSDAAAERCPDHSIAGVRLLRDRAYPHPDALEWRWSRWSAAATAVV